MSKLSEHYMQEKEKEKEFELDLGYQEWLRDNIAEPSENELDEMEQDLLNKSCFLSNEIITHQDVNNTNYNPMEEQL